jgi:hypothetical protein
MPEPPDDATPLDRSLESAHDLPMPSARVAKMLELASELGDEERLELAEELWEHVPDTVSPEWETEIRKRAAEMDAAEARGEEVGLVLTIDEAIQRARRPGHDDEG